MIRHLLHKEYYPAEFTPDKLPEAEAHTGNFARPQSDPLGQSADTDCWLGRVDHCLEFLRRSSLCTANLDLVTFEWKGRDPPLPLPVFDAKRSCVDWERLDGWAAENRVDLWKTEELVGGRERKHDE